MIKQIKSAEEKYTKTNKTYKDRHYSKDTTLTQYSC